MKGEWSRRAILGTAGGALVACSSKETTPRPSIEFTAVPPSEEGSPDKLFRIEGRVTRAPAGYRMVLYARAGPWWVQPTADEPFTSIGPDSRWKSVTHPGSAYAALLVSPQFRPPLTLEQLPRQGGSIAAVAVAKGPSLPGARPKALLFSGYEWHARDEASDRGGTRNLYSANNAWTDAQGHLHLRLTKRTGVWTAAEVRLSRSLGYGTYRFEVRDISRLEPAAVFTIFTWDTDGPSREMDVEISRWGEPNGKNAQYVVQPYYIPANCVRFHAPPGRLTHSFEWRPGTVSFRTTSRTGRLAPETLIDEHTFSSGVPDAGNETIRLNLYRFGSRRSPLQAECEVVVERFEYLP